MKKRKRYSWELNDWVIEQLPKQLRESFFHTGWNVFGIYELVKEGLALEKANKALHLTAEKRGK
uniref:Uncharacterized protein n=1 Tax=viral metagenome TaxID=1070528 RepID=A0A6M3KFH9_9ZZZZ